MRVWTLLFAAPDHPLVSARVVAPAKAVAQAFLRDYRADIIQYGGDLQVPPGLLRVEFRSPPDPFVVLKLSRFGLTGSESEPRVFTRVEVPLLEQTH